MITPQNTSLTQNTNTKILFLSDRFGKNPYYPVNFKMSKLNYSLLLTLRKKNNNETQTTKP